MATAADAAMRGTFRAPGPVDRADLRRLTARWHVATTDAQVEAGSARLAAARAGKRPARGERTIQAWVVAALREHRANRTLFAAVARPGRRGWAGERGPRRVRVGHLAARGLTSDRRPLPCPPRRLPPLPHHERRADWECGVRPGRHRRGRVNAVEIDPIGTAGRSGFCSLHIPASGLGSKLQPTPP